MKNLPISLTVVFLVLGILLSMQFESSKAAVIALNNQTPEDFAVMIKNLSDKKYDLKSEKIELRSQLRIFENDTTKEEEIVASMEKEINKLKVISGSKSAIGPGITITIYKSSDNTPLNFDDLIAITNDLWSIKTEAISINNIRIIDSTRISEGVSENGDIHITIDNKQLEYPIIINAIGDPKRLESDINTGGRYLFQLQTSPWNFKIDTMQKEKLELPAVDVLQPFNYAQPVVEN